MAERAKKVTPKDSWAWFVSKYEALGYKSLSQYATAVGLQKSSLSRYFHLERQIPSGTIGTLCHTLQVSPEELLTAVGALTWTKPKTR